MRSTREMLEGCFNGEIPVERVNPQPGQSKFYYIDAQGQNEDFFQPEKIKTIDIPDDYFSPQSSGQQDLPFSGNAYNPDAWYSDALYFGNSGSRLSDDFENNNLDDGMFVPEDDNVPLLEDIAKDIKGHETPLEYPYLDTKGYITTGAGTNVDNWRNFQKINWLINGRPASAEEKRKGYDRFQYLKNPDNFGGKKQYGQKIAAKRFQYETNLKIDNNEINRLMQEHLQRDLAHVRCQFSNFDNFPRPMQKVLLDIHYNTGKLTADEWPKLYDAIARKDILQIAEQTHRKDIGDKRNDWAKEQILSIRSKW